MRSPLTFPLLAVALLAPASSLAIEVRLTIAPANGGLVALRQADPAIQRYFRPDSTGVLVPVDGLSRVIRNKTFTWSPAVSTGLIFRFASEADSTRCRLGIGTHFVTFNDGEDTRAAPAITLHLGTEHRQVFAGLLLTATDDVRFPGDTYRKEKDKPKEIVVPTEEADSFVAKRVSRELNVYAGVVFPLTR